MQLPKCLFTRRLQEAPTLIWALCMLATQTCVVASCQHACHEGLNDMINAYSLSLFFVATSALVWLNNLIQCNTSVLSLLPV